MKQPKPSKQTLEQQYITQLKSTVVLSSEYNVSSTTIRNWLKSYNIPIRNQTEASRLHNTLVTKKPDPSYEDFYQSYMVDRLPIHSLYKKWHIAQPRIYELIEKYNLPKRTEEEHSQTHSKIKKQKWLSRMPSREEVIEVYRKTKNLISTRKELNISDHSMRKLVSEYGINVNIPWRSNAEEEILQFCKQTRPDLEWLSSVKNLIPPYEIDIVCHDIKLAIEYCGIYWHSELRGKDKFYHRNKMLLCKEAGYELITIFETDPIDIVKSILSIKMGVSKRLMARKCSLAKIHPKIASQFHAENHLHGSVGGSLHLGLLYENELVYLASFGKNRFSRDDSWECTRMTGAKGITVAGGPSRLFKEFKRLYPGKTLTTFADLRFGSGKNYDYHMKRLNDSLPNYRYFKIGDQTKLYSRNAFQKHKLKKFKSYDENLTEWQIMQAEGYDRIWDCGNAKFQII